MNHRLYGCTLFSVIYDHTRPLHLIVGVSIFRFETHFTIVVDQTLFAASFCLNDLLETEDPLLVNLQQLEYNLVQGAGAAPLSGTFCRHLQTQRGAGAPRPS